LKVECKNWESGGIKGGGVCSIGLFKGRPSYGTCILSCKEYKGPKMTAKEIIKQGHTQEPSLLQKAKNLGKEITKTAKRAVKGEEIKVPQAVADDRWATCSGCKEFRAGTCNKCGCGLRNKIWWASAECPLGYWSNLAKDTEGKVAIIIPARNEPYLCKTVKDLYRTALGEFEVWVVLDAWDKHLDQIQEIKELKKDNIHIIENEKPMGLRYGMNLPASLTDAKYLFKIDAHMSFSVGFDLALKAKCKPKTVCVPRLRSLDADTWTPGNRFLDHARFDKDFKMHYWTERDDEEMLCNIGCNWFTTKEWWWEIGGQDESMGLWGQSGIEVSLKTWLNGGRQILVKEATSNHLFRKKFPYRLNGNHVAETKNKTKELWENHPGLPELLERFKPIPDWHDE